MDKKEKLRLELQIKQILYYVENKTEQEKMIAILEKYNDKMPDSKLKDFFDKWVKKTKKDYFDKVDFLLKDIFDGKIENSDKKLINEMLKEMQPIVEKAEKTIWDKFLDLFSWS